MKIYLFAVILSFSVVFASAQDSLLVPIAIQHKQLIHYQNGNFSGSSVDSLLSEIAKHRYVLIGETHHTNEVIRFAEHLTKKIEFDNYIMEGNQSVTNLLEKNLQHPESYTPQLLKKYADHLGFYTFDKDRALTESFLKQGKPVIELDQVFFNSDGLLLEELSQITKNAEARKVYQELVKISNKRWQTYQQNPITQPPFNEEQIPLMYSRTLAKKLVPLLSMNITDGERQIIEDLIKSNEIYALAMEGKGYQSHQTRISFMKQTLLDHYPQLKQKRNLFKFGANHVTKYSSLIQDSPDIGNLAFNLADSEQEESMHIAIVQRSGYAGSFFGKQAEAEGLPYLKVFNDLAQHKEEWALFDLNKIRKEAKKKKINLPSFSLKNLMEGFDYLIIIPEATAQSKG